MLKGSGCWRPISVNVPGPVRKLGLRSRQAQLRLTDAANIAEGAQGRLLEHRAEKCTRFSAFNDAQVLAKASDPFRKMDPFFGPML